MDGNMERTSAERAFLLGLEKLTRETSIVISGCGCCGSPGLSALEEKDKHPEAGYGNGSAAEVEWLVPGEYGWEQGLRPVKP